MAREKERILIANLKSNLPSLKELLKSDGEDEFYRFYHQSFKVFYLQNTTKRIVEALQALLPNQELNEWFLKIVKEGTSGEFSHRETNSRWLEETRPILEAFFHARRFLELAVSEGEKITEPPQVLPSGWAAFLYLYNLR